MYPFNASNLFPAVVRREISSRAMFVQPVAGTDNYSRQVCWYSSGTGASSLWLRAPWWSRRCLWSNGCARKL